MMMRIFGMFVFFSTALFSIITTDAQVAASLKSANLATEKIVRSRNSSVNADKHELGTANRISSAANGSDAMLATSTGRFSAPGTNGNPVRISEPVTGVAASIYRVASNDVLDIRLKGMDSSASTLYTVGMDGTLDYPLVNSPLPVDGLTPEEVATLIVKRVKIYERAKVSVSVRDYASHFVIVTGAVANPGSKSLRREAVPLYVLLTEAEPRSDSSTATILRHGQVVAEVSLGNQDALNVFVASGDVIKVNVPSVRTRVFFYVIGDVNSPGQKDFFTGMTLSQGIVIAGGMKSETAHLVRIFHRNSDGRLISTDYDLSLIDQGKMPDPELKAGDRIEVRR